MAKYDFFHYIYPPRPSNAVPITELDYWDNNMLLAQPKLNGSNGVLFMNKTETLFYNRHGQIMSNVSISKSEFRNLYSGDGWMVLNGEYLNKSKSDETNQVFNHKFVVFDILVYNGEYLLGSTFLERVQLLDKLFGQNDSSKSYLYSISDDIFRVKTFQTGFKSLFENLTKIDMIEGLVCKRKSGRLEIGNTENNNTKSQIKFRKATKNYKF